ncbi:hypothetical protein MRB53_034206 [Persea americana]|uniref:Uncharacterized protein n=1 Tax=Persea americana TaxID=3435 RepID=A0ACC2KWM6_PERAE|nr:hypothetical protein MRB53_034206 [Persea americana]
MHTQRHVAPCADHKFQKTKSMMSVSGDSHAVPLNLHQSDICWWCGGENESFFLQDLALEMGVRKQRKFLTVAPFECAWRKELKFKEAGRGCVAFEASADNDVTVVFREQVGSQHYHYRTDNSPNYTIVLGSHRNRRLKIEVNGKTVVDVAGVGLCCSEEFQSYWISIYDGLICIGKGHYPFQNLVFEWLDSKPNCSVQYVGLSSWDKHVGYRNVNVLPLTQHHNFLWKHVDHIGYGGGEEEEEEEGAEDELEEGIDECEVWGAGSFLESWDLSDMFFIVGTEEKFSMLFFNTSTLVRQRLWSHNLVL